MGECEHMTELRTYLQSNQISIYSEHGDNGWVNVHCGQCKTIYETVIKQKALCQNDTQQDEAPGIGDS